MTKAQLKRKIDELARCSRVYGVTLDAAENEKAKELMIEILDQIDVMYQGAADDEDFDSCDCCGKPLTHDDEMSYCRECKATPEEIVCKGCGESQVLKDDGYCWPCHEYGCPARIIDMIDARYE